MTGYAIAFLPVLAGTLGLSPMPGRGGDYRGDLARLLAWRPDLVLSMTTGEEMIAAVTLGDDLARAGTLWRHLPVADFSTPAAQTAALWPATAAEALRLLAGGGRVLVHCLGGCGRSGMACLRLMVEAGEPPASALARLRTVRPCAVETEAQRLWASTA